MYISDEDIFYLKGREMKVIIDIPKDHKRVIDNLVEDCKGYLLPQEVETRLATAVKIGTVIPDNATNGDMIKVMFPNAIIEINELGSMVHVKYNNHTCWVNYELDWWNAPYKREVEE
jgi:hypothetical protein